MFFGGGWGGGGANDGVDEGLVRRMQSALNAAARLIFNLRRSDHITDALVSLHWLRVSERIDYKIAVQSSSWRRAAVSGAARLCR